MLTFRALLLFTVAISATSASVVNPAANDVEKQVFQVYTDAVEIPAEDSHGEGEFDAIKVTPYGYKAVMLQNVPGRKVNCWRCSRPCDAYMCCDDGWPQCCCTNCGSSSVRCYCCRV